MDRTELQRQIAGLATLDEPVRRALYLYVAARPGDVSRDEAARAVRVSRALAAFHLDRLAAEGLLAVAYRRLSGRSGPGAGRPSKLYRRSERQLAVSVPPRAYELAARILADTMDAKNASRARATLRKTARTTGTAIGARAKPGAGARPGRRKLLAATVAALAAQGYEPRQVGDEVRLMNCPFHGLVGEHRELVCGMNQALVAGVVAGLNVPGVRADLDPQPGQCCVVLRLAKA